MSAAMSPPHPRQRTHAFIIHSPESYREAIGLRSAAQGVSSAPSSSGSSGSSTTSTSTSTSSGGERSGLYTFQVNRTAPPSSPMKPKQEQPKEEPEPAAPQPTLPIAEEPRAASPGSASSSRRSSGEVQFRAGRSDTLPAYPEQRHGSIGSDSGSSSQGSETERRGKEFKDMPRKRRRTSPNELHILETEFARNNKPCKEERERIAATMGMDEKAVQVWFQNKRQSCRRQQSTGSAAMRTSSMPAGAHASHGTFQDENAVPPMMRALSFAPPYASKPAFAVYNASSFGTSFNANSNSTANANANTSAGPAALPADAGPQPAKRAKSLRLAMSADGKAELVERSPLKPIHQNSATAPAEIPHMQFPQFAQVPQLAMRFASVPLSGMETECATSLLFLKSGHWP